jgi:hypothetical protein
MHSTPRTHYLKFYLFPLPSNFLALSSYRTVNWDNLPVPGIQATQHAVETLKYESVVSIVQGFIEGDVLTKEEHAALHSSLPHSNVSYPHSFLVHPVHQHPADYESKFVASVVGAFAWDVSLRNLLPENVNGILIEVRNTCNQTCLYEISGKDAFYLGENAVRETTYDHMEIVRDLSFHTNPNFTSTPGHCQYKIVSYDDYLRLYPNYDTPLTNPVCSCSCDDTAYFSYRNLF